MKKKSVGFILADIAYIGMMVLPILCGIVISVLTSPASEGIEITGALIYFSIPMPLQDLLIGESQVN